MARSPVTAQNDGRIGAAADAVRCSTSSLPWSTGAPASPAHSSASAPAAGHRHFVHDALARGAAKCVALHGWSNDSSPGHGRMSTAIFEPTR